MSFLYPVFLLAGLAIAIPILIHFLNFRSLKTVYFSNTRFLNNLKKSNKNVNRVLHWLILLLRILFVLALVFAFAYPFFKSGDANNSALPELNIVYIDNSPSTELNFNKYSILNESLERAKSFVENSSASSTYLLLTNQFSAADENLLSKEQMMAKLATIDYYGISRTNNQVINRIFQLRNLHKNYNTNVIYISDFQSVKTERANVVNDSSLVLNIVHIKPEYIGNLSVDSCWFEEPIHFLNKKERLNALLRNWSDNPVSATVRLFIKDSLISTQVIDLQAKTSVSTAFEFTVSTLGSTSGYLEVDDEELPFDNRLYFNVYVPQQLKILEIYKSEPSKYLKAIFKNDEDNLKLTSEQHNTANFGTLENYNLVILNELNINDQNQTEQLNQYISGGGNVLMLPDVTTQQSALNNWLNTAFGIHIESVDTGRNAVSSINYNSKLYKDVFQKQQSNLNLPTFSKLLVLKPENPKTEWLLHTLEGFPVLNVTPMGKGNFFLLATSLHPKISNFATHPLFVPTIFQIANQSGAALPNYYILSDMLNIEVADYNSDNEGNKINITSEVLTSNLTASVQAEGKKQIVLEGKWLKAANYGISDSDRKLNDFSVNYSRTESNIQSVEESEILAYFEGMNVSKVNAISNQFGSSTPLQTETPMWFYILLLAFILIIAEGIILKFK